MTTDDHAFGSNELTPELVRGASFDDLDGRYDATEVRTFLDRVASALEVFLADDSRTAMQAEFARNAEIAKQVLDAGQTAAEQMRRQAAEEAKRILDEARDATLGLRETVDEEIEQARVQVDAMRGTFIQDLRDLYDRIGASLYRFERAVEESSPAPIREPRKVDEVRDAAPAAGAVRVPEPEPAPAPEPAIEARRPVDPVPLADPQPDLPDGAKPPAWQQLPAEAWTSSTDDPVASAVEEPKVEAAPVLDAEPEPEPEAEAPESESSAPEQAVTLDDPFAVVEDEPLAPGEPLVDLREMATPSPEPAPLPSDAGGSWLDEPVVADDARPGSSASEPADGTNLAHDDALAEALIAGDGPIPAPVLSESEPPGASAAPVPAPLPPAPGTAQVEASSDSLEIRQVILNLSASGHPREQIATYLADQLHLRDPNAMIDATLGPVE